MGSCTGSACREHTPASHAAAGSMGPPQWLQRRPTSCASCQLLSSEQQALQLHSKLYPICSCLRLTALTLSPT